MTTSAKIIAHSAQRDFPQAPPLITLQLRYPKFIHGEFLTHRVFSRNSSSSRAIPVKSLIQDVLDDPVIPTFWGRNQRGMQAAEETNATIGGKTREEAWLAARDSAVESALAFSAAGYHKQLVNRLIEPFSHINTVVTATEWENFMKLRNSPEAQPEMHALAKAILDAISTSRPRILAPGEWHLPYMDPEESANVESAHPMIGFWPSVSTRISVARCARVSYLTGIWSEKSMNDDLDLYRRLVDDSHLSPFEHQASAEKVDLQRPDLWGNLHGWRQLRKMLEVTGY